MAFPFVRRDVPGGDRPTVRTDLHLHSRASTDTGSWILSRSLMPESFVDPADAYAACKRRGMDFVTLTDHNTISGAMEIAHHPDVIVGVEITTCFPEDRVPMHVLAWGIDDALWADIDRARANIVDLVDLLDERATPCALAHPLHRVGDTLTVDHIERCLLLFRIWEGRNGARPRDCNEVATSIARASSPALLARLADKHDMAPRASGAPALTGGSDDHSVLSVACAWTETPPAGSPEALLEHLWSARTDPGGDHGTATALAQSVGTLPIKRYLGAGAPGLPESLRGLVSELVQHPIGDAASPRTASDLARGGLETFGDDISRRLRRDRAFVNTYRRIGRTPDGATRSHARIRLTTGWLHRQALSAAVRPEGLSLWNLGARVDSLGQAGMLAVPYYLAGRYWRDEIRHAHGFSEAFFGTPFERREATTHALVVTDTYDEINGAAGTMRRLAAWSGAQATPPVTVATCGPIATRRPGLIRLQTVGDVPVPAYGASDWRLGIPSALDLLDAIDRTGATVVHAATPGPMGIAGLLAAQTLGLPFVASYHTEFADYALALTGDRLVGDLAGRAVGWFYAQARRVYVPTRTSGRGLMDQGISPTRLFIFGRGIDTVTFTPERRSRMMRRRMGGRDAIAVLYVGRISQEKGLDTLVAAFTAASRRDLRLELVLVGDGPYRGRLEQALAGTPCRFLGPLTGTTLAAAYASADMFCLPSNTETYGQVVVEAAASGLPTIVTDQGGAHESVIDGETGLIVPADDPDALSDAIVTLAGDEDMRARLGALGRRTAERKRSWDDVFHQLVASYADVELNGPAAGGESMSRSPALDARR
jgi:glycosyltransferase involved in cell wall biosynthesis